MKSLRECSGHSWVVVQFENLPLVSGLPRGRIPSEDETPFSGIDFHIVSGLPFCYPARSRLGVVIFCVATGIILTALFRGQTVALTRSFSVSSKIWLT